MIKDTRGAGKYQFNYEDGGCCEVEATHVQEQGNWLYLIGKDRLVYAVNLDKVAIYTYQKTKDKES